MDLNLDELKAHRVLGRGATGTVFLVTSQSSTDHPFALKVVEKSGPHSTSSTSPDVDRRARWEVTVLSRLSHPFLPSLLGKAESPNLLAWAIPFCPGGDLHALRQSHPDRVFSPNALRFYVSELVSALAYLHLQGIVYRDLKPENVLVQASGHLTLTDFDLSRYLSRADAVTAGEWRSGRRRIKVPVMRKAKSARVLPVSWRRISGGGGGCGGWGGGEEGEVVVKGERSKSFVGTEEYVSPEVVRGDGHEFAVDWWALGILTYEMAYGKTPFRGRNRKETFHNVLMHQPEFVGKHSPDLVDLIARLLAKDPSCRLGSRGGAHEVKAHPFFLGVQWDLLADVTRPPVLPSDKVPTADELEGFSIAEYFEKRREGRLRKEMVPVDSPATSSVSEF